MHLAVWNQWGLIGMPMAQVKTIKKEEKCLTTPPPPSSTNASTEAKQAGARKGKGKRMFSGVDAVDVERGQMDMDYWATT